MENEPLIGVISDHSTSVLAGRIRAAGYRTVRVAPEQLTPGQLPSVDAWVIDCDDDNEVADAMAWIEQPVLALSNRPALSDLPGFRSWCERIIKSLDKCTTDLRHSEAAPTRSDPAAFKEVEAVWVLAGSTGGVSAVSDFLAAFTHMPPVAFVYAQHIQQEQEDLLRAIAHANRELVCDMAIGSHWLNPGHLLIVPATRQLNFSKRGGEVHSSRDSWDTHETPNISQLMLAMTGLQPSPAGAIIFSGAGKDGSDGLRALKHLGTKIWAQEPSGAAAASMPQTAIDQGLADKVGSPLELPAAFMTLYPNPCR